MTTIVIVGFFVFTLCGVPIAFALGLAALAGLVAGGLPFNMLAEKMLYSVDSFPLMAIPFFMLAGELIVRGGIMSRLIGFANTVIGRVPGGLGQVTVVSGMGLASVSGTAVADATALGSVLLRPMEKTYGLPFSTAVIASAANLGPILPPSTAMIIYATLAGGSVSIAGLFASGIVPGVMIGIAMMGAIAVIARIRGFPITGERFRLRAVLREARRAYLILLMPVVVIGGIVGGVFTATESGAIAVAYAFVVGFFITKELRLADLPTALLRAGITTSVVGTLIAFAATVTFLFSIDLVPQKLSTLIVGLTDSPLTFLLLVMALMIVVGMFIEPSAAYVMLVPIFTPLAATFGIDPLHFAMVFILNVAVGVLTPPVGTLLFVMCGMTGLTILQLVREVWPFVVIQYGVMLICLFFPGLVLWFPHALGY